MSPFRASAPLAAKPDYVPITLGPQAGVVGCAYWPEQEPRESRKLSELRTGRLRSCRQCPSLEVPRELEMDFVERI